MDNARISCVRICSDDAIVIGDDDGNIAKYGNDGKFMWTIQPLTRDTFALFCLDSRDSLYCATSDPNQVKVYLPSGAFSHVLVSDLKFPWAIGIDGDNNVHVGFYSSIQVFSAKGKLIREYGHELVRVCCIAISRDDPQLVVVMDSSSKLFVFNSTGSFVYTVTGVVDGIDITFGPDNLLWIAEQASDGGRVHFPELFLQLLPPLFHL